MRGGVACFVAAIFLFFCVVYWLWFLLWKREGVALNLKALPLCAGILTTNGLWGSYLALQDRNKVFVF